MNGEMIYNRRLGREEIGKWLDMAGAVTRVDPQLQCDRRLVEQLNSLPDALFYLASSAGGESIGGAALWRDHHGKGVGLVALPLLPEYREHALTQVMKTSLPWFRTATIRHVDVLVDTRHQPGADPLPFPLALELPVWTLGPLTDIGFVRVGTVFRYSMFLGPSRPPVSASAVSDSVHGRAGTDGAVQLPVPTDAPGATQTRLAVSLARAHGCLRVLTPGRSPGASVVLALYDDTLQVWTLVSDPDRTDEVALADAIAAPVLEHGPRRVDIVLAEAVDTAVVRSVAERLESRPVSSGLAHLRRVL